MVSSPELRFDDKVAIITGAGAGMGREHALLLGKRGARIVINDLFPQGAEATAQAVREVGGEAVVIAGSIAERSIAEALVQAAVENFGRVDIVINNAGIIKVRPFEEYSDVEVHRILDVHVMGTWALTQAAWPHLKKQKYGRILNVSSTSIFGMENNAAYVAAKGALFALSRSLALEGGPHGITVNAFGPSAATAMLQETGGSDQAGPMAQAPPSATSAVAAWLVHEDCKSNGEFITSFGRHFGSVFLAETRGVTVFDGDYTPEAVRDEYEKAFDADRYITPKSVMEGMAELWTDMQSAQGKQ